MPKRKLEPKVAASAKKLSSAVAAIPLSKGTRPRVKPNLTINKPSLTRRLRPVSEPLPEQKIDLPTTDLLPRDLSNYPGLWSDLFMITNTFDQSEHKPPTFRDFRLLCIHKRMCNIFRGFKEVHHRLDFTETVISRCKEMWLESLTFEKQLTWFYLLCFMYFYQPETLLDFTHGLGVKIRLAVNEYSAVREFILQARIQNIPDVHLLMNVLHRNDDAFVHCATVHTHGFEKCFDQYFTVDTEKLKFLNNTLTCPRLVHSLQGVKTEAMGTLREYCAAKENVLSVVSREDTRKDLTESLSLIGNNLVDKLFSCLSRPTTGPSQTGSSSVLSEAGPSNT